MTILHTTRRSLLNPVQPWYRNGSPLANSLIAYWRLDEVSGSRADSVGANTLTDNNTVGSDTGRVYSLAAAMIRANSEYLDIVSNSLLQTGNVDFWLGMWVNLATLPGAGLTHTLMSKENAISGSAEYRIDYNGSANRFRFFVFNSIGGNSGVNADNFGAASTLTWYFIFARHVATEQNVYISVNGGVENSAAVTIIPDPSNSTLRIGARAAGSVIDFFDGRVGPVMFGKNYVPTANDIAWLYNGGLGRT